MPPKPWTLIDSRTERSYRVFALRTDRARSPRTGAVHDFFVLDSAPWVNIIPLTKDREVILVQQYRHGTRDVTLEIPGGLVEAGDTPETAAHRELMEETGYRTFEMIPLGTVHPNPAIQGNLCHTFLARHVVSAGSLNLDDREDIEVVCKPLSEIPQLIRTGVITHALVICAFFRLFMEGEGVSR